MASFAAFRPVDPRCAHSTLAAPGDPNAPAPEPDGNTPTNGETNGENWQGQGRFNDFVRNALGPTLLATTTAAWVDTSWSNTSPFATVAATITVNGRTKAITIQLPYDKDKHDPNIDTGDPIHVYLAADSKYYPTWPAMWIDDKIGSTKLFPSSSNLPKGWIVADGTSSTINYGAGRFLKVNATTAGTNAAAGTTGTALSGTYTTARSTTGLSAHADHDHDVDGFCELEEDNDGGGDAFGGWVSSTLGRYINVTGATLTSNGSNSSLTHSGLEPNGGQGHDHTLTGLSHTHTGADPLSVTCVLIERIDNT